jgi:enoyl-CoA hydratase/carnithine racemase
MRQASTDDRVGVVVLTGTGERAFSTGADLDEQAAFLERPNDYWAWMGHFIDAIDAIRICPKPVVARLNGMTVGGGNELNLACDLAVAADDVVLRHVGPSRGSVPAGGATQWLPLLIGDRRAREVLLLNQPISAQQALEWG